jgi:hypothetical protein
LQESNQPLVSGSLLYASYVEDSGPTLELHEHHSC